MSRHAVLIAAAILAAMAVAIVTGRHAPPVGESSPAAVLEKPKPGHLASTLYCEFNDFADLTPLVGFYFRNEGTATAFRLVFIRERDGTQIDAEASDEARWHLDGADDPAVLRDPRGDTLINLYAYDPARPGGAWFEAGLRSTRYRNLGGRCRHVP